MDYLQLIKPKYLSEEFIKPYSERKPPMNNFGLIVALRTYSRYVSELGRREYWWEICLRVVEYSISLAEGKIAHEELVEEAKELYDHLYNLKSFPAGRTLWLGGSKQSALDPSGNWNCVFRNIDSISSFAEIMYWLMLGSGTGFSVEKNNISKLPSFYGGKKVKYTGIEGCKKGRENTVLIVNGEEYELDRAYLTSIEDTIVNKLPKYKSGNNIFTKVESHDIKLIFGDSKSGWCTGVRAFLELLTYKGSLNIEVDLSEIRKAGEKVNTFGGRASGPVSVMKLLQGVYNTISNRRRLDSVQCLDICNHIGLAIVSGGVRRSSEIALSDSKDIHFIEAKKDLYYDPAKAHLQKIRSMSNNSVMYDKKPSKKKLSKILEVIKTNGDPGFWIRANSRALAKGEIDGTNPCGEAALRDKQSCNLTTQNLVAFIKEENGRKSIDWEALRTSTKIITRIGSRQTLCSQWHPEWDKVQKAERILGVSYTGYGDLVEELNLSIEEQKELQVFIKNTAVEEANEYHKRLGINPSFRVTLIKPEGTISLLPDVSNGLHDRYGRYYIKRMRISRYDPLAWVLKDLGLSPSPENNQGDDLLGDKCDTWVYTFGVSSNTSRRAIDVPAVEQLERYKLIQDNYCDRGHNASVTVTVAEDEWKEVRDWMYDNWSSIIGLTFLGKYDPAVDEKASHPQLPFEPATEERVKELINNTPILNEKDVIELLKKYESEYVEHKLESSCETGNCPIR